MAGALRTRPLLLGHRGARARKTIPENTLASFDQALADGCDGFEFDVRLTADGVAVICHDSTFRGIEIASASSGELQSLPHLEEILDRYGNHAFLDIELKVAGLEKTTASLLEEIRPSRGFVVSSFLPDVVQAIHSVDPEISVGLICETRAELRVWNHVPAEYVIPHYKLADSVVLAELKDAGKKVLVWTVNTASAVRRFRDLGVDGIISDETRLLCKIVGARQEHGG
jgi:glycerophosphoryl diester phosphodiesterase